MGGWTGIWQWIIVLAIVLILFGGRGKISKIMGDVGKGIKSFKTGIKGDDAEADEDTAEGEKPALRSEAAEETVAKKPEESAAKS